MHVTYVRQRGLTYQVISFTTWYVKYGKKKLDRVALNVIRLFIGCTVISKHGVKHAAGKARKH